MKGFRFFASWLFFVFALTANGYGQAASETRKDEIVRSQEFLRVMYPSLNGKNYTLTVETYLAYDQPGVAANSVRMDVGEGPKDLYLGHSSGCLYTITPTPAGWPRELGPPPAAIVSPPASQDDRCTSGPIYPKQYLTAGFQFDKGAHLVGFSADGPFINDRKADNDVYEIVRSHPEMTYPEILTTFKQHGTKYGPGDKKQFIENLPMKQLESLLGKLQIKSVAVQEMDKNGNLVPWDRRWLLPDWTVKAVTEDDERVTYELHFSHLNGYLIALLNCRKSPSCSQD